MSYRSLLLAAAATAIVGACTVGPDYEGPELSVRGDDFAVSPDAAAAAPIDLDWWRAMDDDVLTGLVQMTAKGNLDIEEAEARVREARALRGVAQGGLGPSIGTDGSYTETELSRNGQLLGFAPPGATDRLSIYSAGFDAAWEIDLFGGTRREVEAANARFQSEVERRRAAVLSAVSETARNYIELRGLQAEARITRDNARTQARTLSLVAQRAEVGLASRLDLVRAEAQLEQTRAALPRLDAQIRATIYRLGVLIGRDPQVLVEDLLPTARIPDRADVVPVGLRSDILRRRPDVRAAERDLAAATADIGVAVAELFPKFGLTGAAGFESLSTDDLFDDDSGRWSFAPMVDWRLFQGGAIRARIRAEEAQADAEAIRYERAVLTALEEAEASLVTYAEELTTKERFARAVEMQRDAMRLVQQRYEVGEIDFLAVLDAERQLLDLEQQLVRSDRQAGTQLVALYKALGGGWEAFEPRIRVGALRTDDAEGAR